MRRLRTATPASRSKRADDSSISSTSSLPYKGSSRSASLSAAAVAAVAPSKAPRVELVVKLGGSALTDKATPHTVHPARFSAAVDAMARLHAFGIGFIVVHGAGSFGHFEASLHKISSGSASALGVAATHAAVTRLNALVVDALIARGVPAVGVSPLLVPAKVRVDFVAALLDRGHLPVLHGDACYAGDGRTAVLSGDALVASLVSAFEFVTRAVFLSDVRGVLAAPPDETGNAGEREDTVVRQVTVNAAGEVCLQKDVRASTAPHDATGGIMAKVAAAAKCVGEGEGRVTAFIAGVGTEDAECALLGRLPEPWTRLGCTRIVYQVDEGDAGSEIVPDAEAVEGRAGGRRRWFAL